MSAIINVTLTLGLSIAAVAYIMYGAVHVPLGVGETDKVWAIYATRTAIRSAAVAGEYVGLWHRLNFTRYIQQNYIYHEFKGNPHVKISNGSMDGIQVRIYDVHSRVENSPALIWIHGGGWTTRSPEFDDRLCSHLAEKLGIIVVSIRYRLAPEHPYPIPFDDCYKAAVHFLANAASFSVDGKRVAIGGSSAGANLAAAVSLKMRDEMLTVQPSHQLLIAPCLQALDFNLPSYQLYEHNGFLPRSLMVDFWLWYLAGGHANSSVVAGNGHVIASEARKQLAFVDHNLIPRKFIPTGYLPESPNHSPKADLWTMLKPVLLDPYAVPLMASDLSGLPSAYIATAEYDVLRDDGILYGRRLKEAGIPVIHHHHPEAFHAILDLPSVDWSIRALDDVIQYLQSHL